MLSDNKKVYILEKASELCKSKSYPNFTQANIIRRAHKEGWPENQTTKSTLSKYLGSPETAYSNVPLIFYDVMLDMMKEDGETFSISKEQERLSTDDFPHILSMFMNIGDHDDKEARESLPGDYWAYMPSIEKPDCIVKFLLRIKETRDGTLSAEELFYYNKDGFSDVMKQKSSGYIVGKNGHSMMVLNDPSSHLPKLYLLRNIMGPNNKCFSFSGGTMTVNADSDAVKIMQRKIKCIRSKDPITTDKKALIEQYGMGLHTRETNDEIIKGMFETLTPNKQGQAFYI